MSLYDGTLLVVFFGTITLFVLWGLIAGLGVEPRILVCWLAILIPPLVAYQALTAEHAGDLTEDHAGSITLAGCAIGWACLGFFRTPRRVGKWIWFAFYPGLAWMMVAAMDLLVNGFHLRLF